MQTPVERLESFERIQDRYREHLASSRFADYEVKISKNDLVWMCENLAAKLSQAAYEYRQGLTEPTEKTP